MEAFLACDEDDVPPTAVSRRQPKAGSGRRSEDLEGVALIRNMFYHDV